MKAYTSPPVEFTHTSTVIGVRRVTTNDDHTQSPSPTHHSLSQSPRSSITVRAGMIRTSLLADEEPSSTFIKSRFVEDLRIDGQSEGEEYDIFELDDVTSNN